ncbi:MAG: YqgE/AlgH family protein [Tannerella sp.]|jgi:putative transcriptional regulator|nr:YqgE/AlgH family protein [Tannerella sp.]
MSQEKDIFKIKHNNLRPGKGRLLISEPFLQNIYFQRAVILLVEHNLKGSMGFVLNKRTNLIINDFFPEMKYFPDIPIYLGGPVHSNHLFFIHTLGGEIIPDGVKVAENLYFDGHFEVLKRYIMQGGAVEGKVKFFLGYSGWSENQLIDEIIRDSWLVCNSSIKNIMRAEGDAFWNHSIDSLGSPYKTWKNYPKNPEWN